jgi:hypothetical protein
LLESLPLRLPVLLLPLLMLAPCACSVATE